MPRLKRRRVPPTENWQQLRLFTQSREQESYEVLRPCTLFGYSIAARARQVGVPERTLRRRLDRFDRAGMASLFDLDPPLKPADGRLLPPRLRQLIIDLAAEHPPFRPHELATICHVRFGRRPSPHTVKRILAEGGRPSRVGRRYPAYEQITDPSERRLAVVRLHAEGWTITTIAEYLQTSRARIYEVLKRWIAEGVRGLDDKSHAPKNPPRKVDLKAMAAIRRLQANPELGEFRVHAALAQVGIHLSPRTCGRILALNRKLYGLPGPASVEPHEKKPMPFAAQRRHQYWSVDVRYIEDNQVSDKPVYVIAVLENFSRAILASLLTPRQDLTAYLIVLRAAIREHGCPEALVSDSGSIFKAKQAQRIYAALGIEKHQIERGQPWQNYIEAMFSVMRRMADYHLAAAETWAEMHAAHEQFYLDYNLQPHFAHQKRADHKRSPLAVLGWVHGAWCSDEELDRLFRVRADRRLDKAGYVRYRRWRIYGERGLAGEHAAVWLFGETVTLEYADTALAQYKVEYEPDERHIRALTEPHLFPARFPVLQPFLWDDLSGVEWRVVLRLHPYKKRRARVQDATVQERLFP
jgi:transposase InsO family protein